MGTTGLLRYLTPFAMVVNIWVYLSGKTVAVDASVWLHQLCLRYPHEMHAGNHSPVVAAFVKRASDLANSGANLIFVFENRKVAAKAQTDKKRAEKRAAAYAALQGCEDSDEGLDIDEKVLKALLSVTPELVTAVVAELRRTGFKYVVAPGEADSQLVYLARARTDVEVVLTVDSDLITNGCPNVLLKVNYHTGLGVLFSHELFKAIARALPPVPAASSAAAAAAASSSSSASEASVAAVVSVVNHADAAGAAVSDTACAPAVNSGITAAVPAAGELIRVDGSAPAAVERTAEERDREQFVEVALTQAAEVAGSIELLRLFYMHGYEVFVYYGALAGTDYEKFPGVGPMRALRCVTEAAASSGSLGPDSLVSAAKKVGVKLPADAATRIARVVRCFRHALVYDRETMSHVSLSGAALASLKEEEVGAVILTKSAAPSCAPLAQWHALGLTCTAKDCSVCDDARTGSFAPGNVGRCKLHYVCYDTQCSCHTAGGGSCPNTAVACVSLQRRPGFATTSGLTYDDVEGSYVAPTQEAVNALSVAELGRWLTMRLVPHSGQRKGELQNMVLELAKREAEPTYGRVVLYDVHGASAHQRWREDVKKMRENASTWLTRDGVWVSGDELAAQAPELPNEVMYSYFAPLIGDRDPSTTKTKVIDGSFERMAGLRHVDFSMRLHPDTKECFIRNKNPASMRKELHDVMVKCEYEPPAENAPAGTVGESEHREMFSAARSTFHAA